MKKPDYAADQNCPVCQRHVDDCEDRRRCVKTARGLEGVRLRAMVRQAQWVIDYPAHVRCA